MQFSAKSPQLKKKKKKKKQTLREEGLIERGVGAYSASYITNEIHKIQPPKAGLTREGGLIER